MQAGRVLVVDANEDAQALLRDVLEGMAFSVEVCADSAQALPLLEQARFDVAMIDPSVPDAASLACHMRTDRSSGHVLALLIDGGALRASAAPSTWPSVCGVLLKPLEADGVRTLMLDLWLRVLERRRAERLARVEPLAADLSMTLDLDQVLRLTADFLCAVPSVAQGYLFLGHGQPLRLDRRIAFGSPPPSVPAMSELNDPAGLVGRVFADGVPRLHKAPGADDDLALWERRLVGEADQALVCVALKSGDSIVGAIELSSRSGGLFSDEDFEYLIALAHPIALAVERSRLHRQLVHDEKLASMGRMAASIAHEINNPLQAIHNSLHLLLSRSFSEEKRERILTMAQMEVDRLITVVRQMLDFYRPSHDVMRPVSVHGLLETVLNVTARQTQERRVQVEREWAALLPRVRGNSGHLKHVFTSLISNAIAAMPDGGRLIVRTRTDSGEQGSASQVVLIEFIDTGPGISADEARTIFDPQSAGLELVISYGIVEQHGGMLSVKSDGRGTTFRVALPVAGEG